MRIKSYFAASVQDAIERARVELGSEAMLMNSRRTDPELKHLGAYEVVFGVANESAAEKAPNAPLPTEQTTGPDLVARELADLRKQIETVKRSVSRRGVPATASEASYPEIAETQEQLLLAGFSESTVQDLIQSIEQRIANHRQDAIRNLRDSLQSGNQEVVRTALTYEIDSRLMTAPGLLGPGETRRPIVFVGPPGSGKTATIAKLALKFGLGARIPVHLISTDTVRVGGSEQLAAYARILGIGFEAVHSVAGLGQAINEFQGKKVVLVDTPGFGPGEMEEAREFANFFSRERQLDVQLVMPAILGSSSAWRIYERHTIFKPAKLLFTHVDDSVSPGEVLELAFRACLPISYLANGQNIPDDIKEASKERLTKDLLSSIRNVTRVAA
jgi:flagellar biosynthesis protein FlhF